MTIPTPIDLLLGCLQFDAPAERLGRLRGYAAEDWAAVLAEGQRHGVLPLVAGRVLRMDLLGLPGEVRQRLQAVRLQAGARNMRLYHALGQILERLNAAGIPVIVLKGAHLAELVYEDIAMRPMGDVDLMVKREDLGRAYTVIEGIGYRAERKFTLEKAIKEHHHLPPLHSEEGPMVEVHWNIVRPEDPLQIDLDGLWQRAQVVEIGGTPARVLSLEDLVIHLSLHLFKDRLAAGLKRLYDVGQVAAIDPGIDWEVVCAASQACGGRRGVYLAMRLAGEILHANIPAQLVTALQPEDDAAAVRAAARQRILGSEEASVHPDLAHLWGSRPLRARASAFWKVMFPPLAYMAQRYRLPEGSLKTYPYYLIRLKDLVRQYNIQVWRIVRGWSVENEQAQMENLLYEWWLWGETSR